MKVPQDHPHTSLVNAIAMASWPRLLATTCLMKMCWWELTACSTTPHYKGPRSSQQLHVPPANSAGRAQRCRTLRPTAAVHKGAATPPLDCPGALRLPSSHPTPSLGSFPSSGTSGVKGHLDLGPRSAEGPLSAQASHTLLVAALQNLV